RGVRRFAEAGGLVLGVCNGFQVLCEAGLLPGALLRNRSLRFRCRPQPLRVENVETAFTNAFNPGAVISLPIAHGDGCYTASDEVLDALEAERRVVFRYCDPEGRVTEAANPNGSARNIAGLVNAAGNVLGMMPHPERHVEALLGSADGAGMFQSILQSVEQGIVSPD
ncbi:MAG TPA: phosphoribosylformylglycinamidine synthase subunit PurQ, partial [Rhodothermales bacterium]|nr:phosphoribosylformylglycinamidine synthase subunit PurQ [Rhodothermales bacterium]